MESHDGDLQTLFAGLHQLIDSPAPPRRLSKRPPRGNHHHLATAAVAVARWFFAETLALLSPIRSQQNAVRMDKLASIFHDKQTHALPRWRLEQSHGFVETELRSLAEEFPHRLRIDQLNRSDQNGHVPPHPIFNQHHPL